MNTLQAKAQVDQRIKILTVSPFSSMYGGELVLLEVAKGIDKQIFAPTVVSCGEGPLLDELRKLDIPVKIIDMPYLTPRGLQGIRFAIGCLPSVYRLGTFIRKHEFDLVYNNILQNPYGAVAAFFAGVPCIWHIHEMGKSRILQWISTRVAGLLATKLIVVSRAVRQLFSSRAQKKIQIVYNGIDPDYYNPEHFPKSMCRQDLRIESHHNVVGFVGRLHPSKRPLDLLHAFDALHKKWPDLLLLYIGEGELREDLLNESRRLDIEQRVRLMGYIKDMRPIYAALDILVLPSHHEAQGRVLIEAMAMNKPVVATHVGGIPETVGKDAGILVPVGNIAALSAAISELIRNPSLADKMGRRGRHRVLEYFTLKQNIKQIEDVLLSVVQMV